jgi:hypothetical protein
LICCSPAYSQQTASTLEKDQAAAALRAKAYALLESLSDQISTLQSAENRARLGSNLAESLWGHNEKRARSLLVSVENDIRAGLQEDGAGGREDYRTFEVFLRLRMDTVERMARHDAELALAFLRATKPEADKGSRHGFADNEQALQLKLAKDVAANNPEFALRLGRQSLAKGFSYDLPPLLSQLSRKHKEHALTLYKEIVAKLKNANLAQNGQAMYFAQGLAHSFTPPQAEEATYRDLINIFITSAFANGCENKNLPEERSEFCGQLASLVPLMESVDPQRGGQLRQWASHGFDSEHRYHGYNELSVLEKDGTVDEILALATKYPTMTREIHWQAMMKAQASGDVERARKIATNSDLDPEMQRRMLDQIDRDQRWTSISEAKLAEVQVQLSKLQTPRERVWLLVFAANRVAPKDRETALKLINQANGIVDSMKPGNEQTQAQLRLAVVYCSIKSDRGFAVMESLVPKLNELVTAAAQLDGYEIKYLRDGEWNMSANGGVGILLTGLAQSAGYFAWCDFERAVSLAAQFERPEIRMMAQLKLAQGIIAGPPKRVQINELPTR